ncbi:MAG: trigger factor [Candidatus Peregrinibacteria bacterium]|nr:trigger factor [Candidatus Peregrinibacteria bacterium]
MSNYKNVSGSKVKFSFKIEEKDLAKAEKQVIKKFQENLDLKGFRKGNVPEDAVRENISKEQIQFESINVAIDKGYKNFIDKNKLAPISQPKVDFSDLQKKPIDIKVEVEIFPEVKLGDYKKIKIKKPEIKIGKDEVDKAIIGVLTQMGESSEVARAAKEGDLCDIDFAGKDDKGAVLPNTDGKNVKVTLGSGQFLPDLEKAFKGMKAGEEKIAVKVKFPKEYHSKDFAGKTIPFDIKLNSVGEISPTGLKDETIEKITGKKATEAEFRTDVEKMILAEKEKGAKGECIKDYEEKLAKIVKGELPQSWMDKEVEMRMAQLKQNPQYTHDPEAFWKTIGKKEDDLIKQFKKDAEANLKVFLGLSEIIKQENIELDKDETKRAALIVEQNLKNAPKGARKEEEMQKVTLNLKIDKFLAGLMI